MSVYDTGALPATADSASTRRVRGCALLPMSLKLRCGTSATIREFSDAHDAQRGAALLEHAIVVDRAWPFDSPLDSSAFDKYFCSRLACVLDVKGTGVVGAFYIKSNFPGRCDHVCNGGFITAPEWRRRGVAEAMATCFVSLARHLGYRLIMFNLVFATNTASIALWEKLGFTRTAVLPGAVRMRKDGAASAIVQPDDTDSFDYFDAYQYCLNLAG